ncbi:hypothetical protein GCM10010149_47430 [Nonomuraea roseoviolacea subsp. roseoviolacea]|uniref:hypothetical protein n=1 Tax=Nonomuraea roseoviolacea TaxID=103837 RepID=UPI0031DC1328
MTAPKLASVINVTRLPNGFFSFTIDGYAFPWTIEHVQTGLTPDGAGPYLTVRIPADRVEVINQAYDH